MPAFRIRTRPAHFRKSDCTGFCEAALPDQRPRGGVVTQRTANPRTPVQFRAWPPTFPSKNNAKRKNLTRNSRESRQTVGTVSGTAKKTTKTAEVSPSGLECPSCTWQADLPPDNLHDDPPSRDRASHAQAGIEHPCAWAHRSHFSEEASVATSDQGTLSSAAAITRAIPAPAMT